MIHLIDELKVIPGVIGACIVSTRDGLRETNLPTIFKPERLTLVGRHLLKIYSAGRINFADLTDITLNYDESVVVARELEKETLVFVICDPTFNHNLLSLSLTVLGEEFKMGDFSKETASAAATITAAGLSPVSGAMGDLLSELKVSLGKVLGPMSGFVFEEVNEDWQKQGFCDFSRIEELIELINQEIVDPDKIAAYRQIISTVLNDFQKG